MPLLSLVLLGLLSASSANAIGYSTNFDGSRFGGGSISVGSLNWTGSGPSSSSSSSWSRPDSNTRATQTYYEHVYHESMLERWLRIRREQELERKRKALEEAKRKADVAAIKSLIAELDKLEGGAAAKAARAKTAEQVDRDEEVFKDWYKEYVALVLQHEQEIWDIVSRIECSDPPPGRHYDSLLVKGLYASPEDAAADVKAGLQDPFTGEHYQDVMAFGKHSHLDWARVAPDHLLGQWDLLSPASEMQLSKLKCANVDTLTCHSNGCRIAMVLISRGQLRVKNLRILGGDGAIVEMPRWLDLQESEKITGKISIWAVRYDPVPMAFLGWMIKDKVEKELGVDAGPDANVMRDTDMRLDAVLQWMGRRPRPAFDPNSTFQVHAVDYPSAGKTDIVDRHVYNTYDKIIKGLRYSNCLTLEGSMHQRCLFY